MPASFGALLRRLRIAASLSQEALAEAAHVSTSAIGAYERGIHAAPHRDTVALLADVLSLDGTPRAEFELAAKRKPRSSREDAGDERLDKLPVQTTSFVGRESDVDEIEELLRRHRVVTITGTGGIGKTRAALHVAARLKATYRDEVAFVDLGSISDETLVLSTIASALRISFPTSSIDIEDFVARLKDRAVLLLLDNCEHLMVASAAFASAIIRAAPKVTILATSRERLRISGEVVYRLSTLPVPDAGPSSASDAQCYAAIQLFIDRATTVAPKFVFTRSCMDLVVDVCRMLDGIPLAIELAAARIPTLALTTLRDQLTLRLSVLSGGNRDMPTRQRTLVAALSWSFDLLGERERIVFRRVSVFVGGWPLEAAQFVCAGESMTADMVCDALASLVEKSLVSVECDSNTLRYCFLQVMRIFALEKATEAGESAMNARRHAEWIASVTVQAAEKDESLPRGVLGWSNRRARYQVEMKNIRAAIEWALGEGGDMLLAASIIMAVFGVWSVSARFEEYARWSRCALTAIDEQKHPRAAALLLFGLSRTALGTERITAAERALGLFKTLGDQAFVARSLTELAWAFQLSGELDSASTTSVGRLERPKPRRS